MLFANKSFILVIELWKSSFMGLPLKKKFKGKAVPDLDLSRPEEGKNYMWIIFYGDSRIKFWGRRGGEGKLLHKSILSWVIPWLTGDRINQICLWPCIWKGVVVLSNAIGAKRLYENHVASSCLRQSWAFVLLIASKNTDSACWHKYCLVYMPLWKNL